VHDPAGEISRFRIGLRGLALAAGVPLRHCRAGHAEVAADFLPGPVIGASALDDLLLALLQ
jgi:hypothetical protein